MTFSLFFKFKTHIRQRRQGPLIPSIVQPSKLSWMNCTSVWTRWKTPLLRKRRCTPSVKILLYHWLSMINNSSIQTKGRVQITCALLTHSCLLWYARQAYEYKCLWPHNRELTVKLKGNTQCNLQKKNNSIDEFSLRLDFSSWLMI